MLLQLVAVKALILPGKASSEDQKAAKELANIEQEVHLLRTMNHPHIVQYLGVDFNAVR
jgi:serine/threonine protein kinase